MCGYMITKEYPCIFPNVYNQNNLHTIDGVYTIQNNLARNLYCRFSVQGCHIQRAQFAHKFEENINI